MDNQIQNSIVSFIWGIADDCLRDVYVRGKYRDVILPMTVIRRLDAMLEDTKTDVLKMKDTMDKAGITNQWPALCNAANQAFCNASPFLLKDLTSRAKKQTLKADFEAYLDGFSPNVQEILEKFKFRNQIDTMIDADILGAVIEKFVSPTINLSPKPVYTDDTMTTIKLPALDNHGMGTIFEELIRKFNEENNEEAGEHWTPRDVVELMADLIIVPVADQIMDATYSCYDGACGNYAQVVVEEDPETKKKSVKQIFPRYHQLDCVEKLLADVKTNGVGKRYLIQHSAGSGKSNSIAWLAHQLIGLEKNGHPMIDSVLVVTDRRILDKQIRDNIKQFMQVANTVAWAEHSGDLRKAIQAGKRIIITTVEKFPYVVPDIGAAHKTNHFAVIIDEAHSGQNGRNSAQMNLALSGLASEDEMDNEDKINAMMEGRKLLPNASYFAFTATPKNKTLETFGTLVVDENGNPVLNEDGEAQHRPFHSYTMKQAIQEGFILDVLKYYTPISSYYKLMKTVQDDPMFDKKRAQKKLRAFVESDSYTISQKAEMMVEHFHEQVISKGKIGGQARVMVVTSSIREKFNSSPTLPDDDINTSVDQTKRLIIAIKNGLEYPSSKNGFKYDDIIDFFNKLSKIFDWPIYEKSTLGNESKRKWYAVILSQWMEGSGLSYIMQRAIDYHKQHPENFWVSAYQPPTIYNDNSKEHRNVVFADTLEAIENIVLFSISNYFLRFSNEYKKIHDVDEFDNNWYEYVEFGTTNPLTILLQRNGFSRESATFIKKHKDEYVAHDGSTDELRLRLSLLDCGNTSVMTEAASIRFNAPKLFLEEG